MLGDPRSFVDVPAEEVTGLFAQEEVADGRAAGMPQVGDSIEHGPVGRAVEDRDHRLETVEGRGPARDLFFGILARSVEGRRIRAAQADHLVSIDLELSAVEIGEAIFITKLGYLFGALVITWDYIDLFATPLENFTRRVHMTPPVHQVSGCEIVVRFRFHVPLQGLEIAMNVGKDQELHLAIVDGLKACKPLRVGDWILLEPVSIAHRLDAVGRVNTTKPDVLTSSPRQPAGKPERASHQASDNCGISATCSAPQVDAENSDRGSQGSRREGGLAYLREIDCGFLT